MNDEEFALVDCAIDRLEQDDIEAALNILRGLANDILPLREPYTKVQAVFRELVEDEEARSFTRLSFAFHEADTVYTDGLLLEVLSYGHGDYGWGVDLAHRIADQLEEVGYYLENMGGGVFAFVRL